MKSLSINREILRLAVPNVVSNITVPLLGLIDTGVAGRVGSDVAIGALSLGSMAFDFVYWNCCFLRMSTTGLTAQSFGAKNWLECKRLLIRSVSAAIVIALLLLLVHNPLTDIILRLFDGDADVLTMARRYVSIRWYSAPADIALFAFNGWFIGMQDSRTPMVIAVIANLTNAGLSLFLALHLGWGIEGIATATVIAQYFALAIAAGVYLFHYSKKIDSITLRSCFTLNELKRFFSVNSNMMQRSFCVVVAYFIHTSVSSRFGATVLAANELLMQLFMLFSFIQDGLAYSAEALSGRYIGAGDYVRLRRVITRIAQMCAVVLTLYGICYPVAWRQLLMLFKPSPDVLEVASQYIAWAIAVPLIGTIAFLLDGVLIGATQAQILRNTTFISLIGYIAMLAVTIPLLGSLGIWISFLIFLLMRGTLLIRPTLRLLHRG